MTLAFLKSVVLSGEPWSASCQTEYDKAQMALSLMREPGEAGQ